MLPYTTKLSSKTIWEKKSTTIGTCECHEKDVGDSFFYRRRWLYPGLQHFWLTALGGPNFWVPPRLEHKGKWAKVWACYFFYLVQDPDPFSNFPEVGSRSKMNPDRGNCPCTWTGKSFCNSCSLPVPVSYSLISVGVCGFLTHLNFFSMLKMSVGGGGVGMFCV